MPLFVGEIMYDLKTNLEPGNPDGHTVLRYLVEVKQMPLEVAIERVYHTVSKCAALYRSDQKKLLTGMFVTGILGLPVFFPFGVSSLLIAGAIGASAFSWQEFGMMRDRLKPEYAALKGSVLLEQFIKWLAQELKERSGQAVTSGQFQPDALTTANILAAYEHTIFAVTEGEHLENNASDPILALFVAKLRQHTNQLPNWVMDAFRHLEQAENQRSAHLDAAYGYMFGNLNQSPSPQPQVGQNTRLLAVDVPSLPVDAEGEQRLGKPQIEISQPQILPSTTQGSNQPLPPFDRSRIVNECKGLMIIGDMGAAKTCVAQHIANGFDGHGIIIFDPHGKTDWGNAYVLSDIAAIYEQMKILLDILGKGDESPLLVIADEWLEIRGDRLNKSRQYRGLAEDFIRLFSTKPRKFNKLGAFVLHSPNVEAAGLDSYLRENYLKVYLGKLAKKEFPAIKDCAYPCTIEDEQQEHPTHGHHTEFKPKGKAPRNLQPLSSAPINIPLAYMNGGEVKVCDHGWDGQLRLEIESIRQRLELLLDSSTPEPNPPSDSSPGKNPEPLNRTPEPLNQPPDEGCTDLEDSSRERSEDSSARFTPLNLTKEQVLALIENLNPELNQTQIIERLWQVKKGGSAAWKEAREQFRELMGE
jgi:hypothetical protein